MLNKERVDEVNTAITAAREAGDDNSDFYWELSVRMFGYMTTRPMLQIIEAVNTAYSDCEHD